MGGHDVFLARYEADGTLGWARAQGGAGTDAVRGVTVDGWGRITITGSFTKTATFGTGTVVTVTATALEDAFAASFNPNGTVRWART